MRFDGQMVVAVFGPERGDFKSATLRPGDSIAVVISECIPPRSDVPSRWNWAGFFSEKGLLARRRETLFEEEIRGGSRFGQHRQTGGAAEKSGERRVTLKCHEFQSVYLSTGSIRKFDVLQAEAPTIGKPHSICHNDNLVEALRYMKCWIQTKLVLPLAGIVGARRGWDGGRGEWQVRV